MSYVLCYYLTCSLKEYHKAGKKLTVSEIADTREQGILDKSNDNNDVNLDLSDEEKHKELNEKEQKDLEEKSNIAKLKNWCEFAKFELTFVAVICLELFWGRIDGVIISIFFNQTQISTHFSWMNVVCFVDAFTYGWAVSICPIFSNLMIKKKIKTTQALALLSAVSISIFGL